MKRTTWTALFLGLTSSAFALASADAAPARSQIALGVLDQTGRQTQDDEQKQKSEPITVYVLQAAGSG